MSRSARIAVVAVTLVLLVVGFVLARPGGDDDTATTPTQTVAPAPPPGAATTATPPPPPPPQPEFATIRVRGGKPVGGVKRITVTKGDRARIEISSPDTTDEIHLHGYDLYRDLKAGGRVRFSFEADADGIYEIELHSSGELVGELAVEPG